MYPSRDFSKRRDVSLVTGAATLTLQAFPDVELGTADIFA